MTANKKTTQRQGFKTNEFIVYPAHGVGQILAIEEQEVAGAKLELFVINFVKDKMTLRVPTAKIAVGRHAQACPKPAMVKRALETLKGRARDQAHHVVAPRPGIRGQDQFRRHRRDRRGRSRPVPFRAAARAVLFRAAALRGRARPAVARNFGGAARHPRPKPSRRSRAALAKGPRRGPKPAERRAPRHAEAEEETEEGRGRGGLSARSSALFCDFNARLRTGHFLWSAIVCDFSRAHGERHRDATMACIGRRRDPQAQRYYAGRTADVRAGQASNVDAGSTSVHRPEQIEIRRRDMRAVLEGREQQRLLGAGAVLVPPELVGGFVEQELAVAGFGRRDPARVGGVDGARPRLTK